MLQEFTDLTYVDNVDLSQDFTSDEIQMPQVVTSICFQGVATGSPVGTMSVEVSIIPDRWVELDGCEKISEDLSETNEFYFILPDIANYGSRLRLCWKSGVNSSGNVQVAYRLMPN